ncbi:MAG: aminopeptidase, partial [Anaerolineae bacterium]|nr:aminopeptidase [Anaerolineae bacterium]
MGGTIHMAVGNAYPKVGGTNQSTLHWDMIHNMRDGSTITVDGDLFYENGEFVVE